MVPVTAALGLSVTIGTRLGEEVEQVPLAPLAIFLHRLPGLGGAGRTAGRCSAFPPGCPAHRP